MALQLSKLIEEKYNNYKLTQDKEATELEIKNLSGMVAVLYAVSSIDSIDETEEGIIKHIYTEILQKAKNLNIDSDLIDRTEKNITSLVSKRDISLSEALRYVIAYKHYKKGNFLSTLEMSIEAIVEADGELSKSEELFLKRFDLFIKKGKDAIADIEQAENADIIPENYYLQGSTTTSNFIQHPSTQLLKQSDNKFKNISSLTPNKFYIIHPMDSNMLLPVDDVTKINDFIIDELRSLACSLGAKKFSYEQSIVSEETEDKSLFFSGKFSSSTGQSGDIESDYKSDTKANNKNLIKKTAEFSGGQKEDKEKVLSSLLWLRNNHSTEKLIEQVYSPNSPILLEDDIYLESYLEENTNLDFKGSMKVAGLNNAETKNKLEIKMNTMKKIKQHIIIEF